MSDPASQVATPELQINKISVQLVANVDKGASSSEAEGHNASSLGTGSDFEFDSSFLPDINDDPPVSPKLIRPSTAAYYLGAFSNNGRLEMIMPQAQSNPLLSSPPYPPVIKQISAPSSPSVSHLKAGDHKDYHFNYFSSSSAPQTPNLHLQQKQGGQLPKQRPGQDSTSFWGINNNDQRRSKSSMLDRRAFELSPLLMQKEVYLAGGLEHNYIISASSCNGPSPADINEELTDEHKYTCISMDRTATSKYYNTKQRSRNSNRKCTLKDFLGWTVNPSSIIKSRAAEPHHDHSYKYASNSVESPRQSTSSSIRSPKPHYLLSGLRKTSPKSPAASPPRSPAAAVKHAPPPTLAHGRQSPTRSPPRPPMSPHALHYKQQKARSDKLPYRQSLLGCLGSVTMSRSRALQTSDNLTFLYIVRPLAASRARP